MPKQEKIEIKDAKLQEEAPDVEAEVVVDSPKKLEELKQETIEGVNREAEEAGQEIEQRFDSLDLESEEKQEAEELAERQEKEIEELEEKTLSQIEGGEGEREPEEGEEKEKKERLEEKETLLPLPFIYKRTTDPKQASYMEWRVSPVILEGEENEPRSDKEIVESVKKQHEEKRWYTEEYWREKGLPVEQLEFTIKDRQIDVYNYNGEKPLTDEHIEQAKEVFAQLGARFPKTIDEVRWLLIDDEQPSLLGDEETFPTNAQALPKHQAIRMMPRGMELFPHRIEAATNFEGTLIHESTHLMFRDFEDEWLGNFQWDYCSEHPNDWELRPIGEGVQRWFNRQTGEMSTDEKFPLQPDQCITFYAKLNYKEDICESMVGYICDPDLLKRVSPDKFDILQQHDVKQEIPDVSVQRLPEDKIKLPEVEPETVYYFVEEPEA